MHVFTGILLYTLKDFSIKKKKEKVQMDIQAFIKYIYNH